MFNFIKKMNVSQKLIFLVSIFIVFFLSFAVVTFVLFNKAKVNGPIYNGIASNKDLVADVLPPPEYIVESYLVVLEMADEKDKAKLSALNSECVRLRSEYEDRHSYWEAKLPAGTLADILLKDSYTTAELFFDVRDKQFIPAINSGDTDTVYKLAHVTLKNYYEDQQREIKKIVDIANQNSTDAEKNANNVMNISVILFLVLGGSFTLLMIILSIYMNKSMNGALKSAILDISEGTDQVADASEQLSDSSQRLAEANSELAASIEETSATLEESSSMINHNTENTRQAALLTAQTKAASDKGNTEMQEMMISMGEIKKSSDKIAKIIKVIDEIAFQTNILALNAAVEAARAGDAGMGFAVVAEEVRNLAQRSAQAARDTADIIESNIELSGNGVSVAKRVGESLAEITEQANKVNELMTEIADASMAQSQGINQINKAISQMEKVTQQNAANADQSAAASEELNAQAESLKEIVEQLAEIVIGQKGIGELYSSNLSSPPKMIHSSNNIKNSNTKYLKSSNKADNWNSDRKEERRTRVVNPEEVIPLDDDTDDF